MSAGGRDEDGRPSALPARARDALRSVRGSRVGQPPADDSRKTKAKEHQQFGPVAGVDRLRLTLAERDQAAWQRRFAVEPDEGLGAAVELGVERRKQLTLF